MIGVEVALLFTTTTTSTTYNNITISSIIIHLTHSNDDVDDENDFIDNIDHESPSARRLHPDCQPVFSATGFLNPLSRCFRSTRPLSVFQCVIKYKANWTHLNTIVVWECVWEP